MIGEPFSIGLFMSRGLSLFSWDRNGILEREMALYQEFVRRGHKVAVFSWGKREERAYHDRFPDIQICHNHLNLPTPLYEWGLPFIHGRVLRCCDVLKTNQASSVPMALRAGTIHGRPVVMRFGFMWSLNSERANGRDHPLTKEAVRIEKTGFRDSDMIICTTPAMAENIGSRAPEAMTKTFVVPNYVNSKVLPPGRWGDDILYDVISVGRLSEEKNQAAIISAARKNRARTLIVGDGPLKNELQQQACGSEVEFIDRLSQADLFNVMTKSRLFVLASEYEGHPKALIEAMYAGVPVIGTDVPGINSLIEHGETGRLCLPDSKSLADAIRQALDDPDGTARMAEKARCMALERYSLEGVADQEISLYGDLMKTSGDARS